MPFAEETIRCWREDIFSKAVACGFFTLEEAEQTQINKTERGYEIIFAKRVYETVKTIAEERKGKHLHKFLSLEVCFVPEPAGQYRIIAKGARDVAEVHKALAIVIGELCLDKCRNIEEKKARRFMTAKAEAARKKKELGKKRKFVREKIKEIVGQSRFQIEYLLVLRKANRFGCRMCLNPSAGKIQKVIFFSPAYKPLELIKEFRSFMRTL
ncbi:MAG TPA: hypothetical protein VF390_01255 [Patescibacteria group bacterium]